MKIPSAAAVALVSTLLTAVVTAQDACPFLPTADAPVLEYALPSTVFRTGELPVTLDGLNAVVTRRPVAAGGTPRVLIERYSSQPSMTWDEASGTVVIQSGACAGTGDSGASTTTTATTSLLSRTFVATAVAAAAAWEPRVGAAATLLAAGLALPQAQARQLQEVCLPSVQVVVEAPSGYKGAVETCLDEIGDPAICPEPFPTYPTCDDPAPSCPVAVVGAGAGGLYTALRMLDEGKIEGKDICVFEMTERVGGRLLSLRGLGPNNDLTVDAGGYRTWPRFTPTTHALITEYLGLGMECYDDSDPCEVFNIIDENGNKDGFTTFVELMMQKLSDAGACWYPYHELHSLTKMDSDMATSADGQVTQLHFSNGVTATATFTTILNIPQRPLMEVVRNSDLDAAGILDEATLDALHSVQTAVATKLYLYYPPGHAFWLKLGLREGEFELDGDARSMLLGGRYHDGHIQCEDESDPDTCHGFLLAVYVNDLSGNKAQFFRRYQRERPEPVTILSNQDLEGRQFLEHVHSRLEEFHLYANTEAPYNGFEATQVFQDSEPPTFAVLSTWNTAVPWAGGAWHAWTDLSTIDLAMQPFVDNNLFVVNEAYSLLQGWAEGSIKAADTILEQYFDIPRPWSFPVDDFNQVVAQTNSQECVEVEDTSGSGGGGDQSGGGGEDVDSPLCFTADAQVLMADGSLKSIAEVQVGDVVDTGTGVGQGLVTAALVHPVNAVVPVASMETPTGVLQGTPDHPVWLESTNEWLGFSELTETVEEQYLDAFYNLEIDADDVYGSSHSYVVHGVVASGLGDHPELNRVFARQAQYQQANAAAATVRQE